MHTQVTAFYGGEIQEEGLADGAFSLTNQREFVTYPHWRMDVILNRVLYMTSFCLHLVEQRVVLQALHVPEAQYKNVLASIFM